MMVDNHNTVDVTVECQVHRGVCVVFFMKGRCRYLQNTIGMRGALPRVPGMVNPGAHYRCPEACGGLFVVRESNDAYNTVCVRAVVEHCSHRRTGYGPWYRGLTCVLPFLFAPGSF